MEQARSNLKPSESIGHSEGDSHAGRWRRETQSAPSFCFTELAAEGSEVRLMRQWGEISFRWKRGKFVKKGQAAGETESDARWVWPGTEGE